jgi:hypothetical protein
LKNFYTLQQALSILEWQYPEKYTLIDTTIFPTKNFYKNLFNSMFLCDDS